MHFFNSNKNLDRFVSTYISSENKINVTGIYDYNTILSEERIIYNILQYIDLVQNNYFRCDYVKLGTYISSLVVEENVFCVGHNELEKISNMGINCFSVKNIKKTIKSNKLVEGNDYIMREKSHYSFNIIYTLAPPKNIYFTPSAIKKCLINCKDIDFINYYSFIDYILHYYNDYQEKVYNEYLMDKENKIKYLDEQVCKQKIIIEKLKLNLLSNELTCDDYDDNSSDYSSHGNEFNKYDMNNDMNNYDMCNDINDVVSNNNINILHNKLIHKRYQSNSFSNSAKPLSGDYENLAHTFNDFTDDKLHIKNEFILNELMDIHDDSPSSIIYNNKNRDNIFSGNELGNQTRKLFKQESMQSIYDDLDEIINYEEIDDDIDGEVYTEINNNIDDEKKNKKYKETDSEKMTLEMFDKVSIVLSSNNSNEMVDTTFKISDTETNFILSDDNHLKLTTNNIELINSEKHIRLSNDEKLSDDESITLFDANNIKDEMNDEKLSDDESITPFDVNYIKDERKNNIINEYLDSPTDKNKMKITSYLKSLNTTTRRTLDLIETQLNTARLSAPSLNNTPLQSSNLEFDDLDTLTNNI